MLQSADYSSLGTSRVVAVNLPRYPEVRFQVSTIYLEHKVSKKPLMLEIKIASFRFNGKFGKSLLGCFYISGIKFCRSTYQTVTSRQVTKKRMAKCSIASSIAEQYRTDIDTLEITNSGLERALENAGAKPKL